MYEVYDRLEELLSEGYGQEFTPVETHGGYLVKRDDLYEVAGVRGGKARSAYYLCTQNKNAQGLITAGARQSPQVGIVSSIAKEIGLPCVVHSVHGSITPELQVAKDNGAELIQHYPGYNNVIVSRSREDAKRRGWVEIPFGMECWAAVEQTALQVASLKEYADQIKRIIIPVGSGMSAAGILWGIQYFELGIPVFGVQVGASPEKRLEKYAPFGWQELMTLEKSPMKYHEYYKDGYVGDLLLDPVYEAKVIPYLEEGDLVWVVGIRKGLGDYM